MTISLDNDWQPILEKLTANESYSKLHDFLKTEYTRNHPPIYPPMTEIWQALTLTPYDKVKVCILGQDPYHGEGQANGLAFSVKKGVKIPPSLQNIYKELHSDLGCPIPTHGDLTKWAKEGVLLLNTVLTVRAHQAFSHRDKGWEEVTDGIIKTLNQRERPVVFILWGSPSRAKKKLIDTHKHVIIESPHPSPLSAYRGFFGSKPFSTANFALIKMGEKPVDWCV